jgi:hypothetical protein
MHVKYLLFVFTFFSYGFSEILGGYYANVSDELMITPVSAAMAGSDLSIGTGTSVESTPGNLPFDSLNRLSLSYAGYYNNSFSTSLLTWSGQPGHNLGISLLAGYVYIPDIWDTRQSSTTESGELSEAKIKVYSASKILFRAGIGRRFTLTPNIALGVGIAANAKRIRLPSLGYGIGLDAGLKTLFPRPGISLALQVENLTSSYIYWSKSFKERSFPHLRAGIGWERTFPYIYGSLRISYATPDLLANEGINSVSYGLTDNDNVIETLDHQEVYKKPSLLVSQGKIGFEYTILRTVAFRVGLANGKLGFGAGLRLMEERAGLDFAYVTHALAGTYQLSAHYSW